MIGFVIGLFIGGFFGFSLAAVIVVCHDADERERELFDRKSVEKGDEMRRQMMLQTKYICC